MIKYTFLWRTAMTRAVAFHSAVLLFEDYFPRLSTSPSISTIDLHFPSSSLGWFLDDKFHIHVCASPTQILIFRYFFLHLNFFFISFRWSESALGDFVAWDLIQLFNFVPLPCMLPFCKKRRRRDSIRTFCCSASSFLSSLKRVTMQIKKNCDSQLSQIGGRETLGH